MVSNEEAARLFERAFARADRRKAVTHKGPVIWLEFRQICSGGPESACGSPAYMLVERRPRCLKHAFDDVLSLLVEP